jgi:hypothetical protein
LNKKYSETFMRKKTKPQPTREKRTLLRPPYPSLNATKPRITTETAQTRRNPNLANIHLGTKLLEISSLSSKPSSRTSTNIENMGMGTLKQKRLPRMS